ncbi:MAG: peptidylprolyl isomerase [Patescibacteria group bacterium]
MKSEQMIAFIFVALFLTFVIAAFFMTRKSDEKTGSNQVTKSTSSQSSSTDATKEALLESQEENIAAEIDQNKVYIASLNTTEGVIRIELNAKMTPKTAANFITLSKKGFYDNTIFHRVIKGFMIQGGDPNGDGTGGPGYKFDDEKFEGEYTRGTVAMANSGPNTNGSQFFIMHADYPLPKNYVIFGKVIEGLDVIDKIAEAEVTDNGMGEVSTPVSPVKILSASIVED